MRATIFLAVLGLASAQTDCDCFRSESEGALQCAPPSCQRCGTGPAGTGGCSTNATAACDCQHGGWPIGAGCVTEETKFVYYIQENDDNCCQMPAAWMTEPHDNNGVRVPPLPYPASRSSWGDACSLATMGFPLPDYARFSEGTCASAGSGYSFRRGACANKEDCDCSTTWNRS